MFVLATTIPYLTWLAVLLVACGALYYRQATSTTAQTSSEFKSFQTLFLTVYTILFMADWMQVRGRVATNSLRGRVNTLRGRARQRPPHLLMRALPPVNGPPAR